jgi:hypothetical protein
MNTNERVGFVLAGWLSQAGLPGHALDFFVSASFTWELVKTVSFMYIQ